MALVEEEERGKLGDEEERPRGPDRKGREAKRASRRSSSVGSPSLLVTKTRGRESAGGGAVRLGIISIADEEDDEAEVEVEVEAGAAVEPPS